jgi:CBS domain-containing protein
MICPTCGFDNVPGSEYCQNCENDLALLDRPEPRDRVEQSLMDDCVEVLNPRSAVTLPADAPVSQAIQTMLEANSGAVLVCEDGEKIVGILTERDLLLKVVATSDQEEDRLSQPLRNFMTPKPEMLREDHSLAFALHKMDFGGYRHMPVHRKDAPVGMISVRDLLSHVTQICENA